MRNGNARTIVTALVAAASMGFGSDAITGEYYDDFASPYWQRIDGISPGGGNAKQVNAATHVIDPWPRYAPYRRIPGTGERMSGAIERYRDVRKLPLTPLPLAPIIGATGGFTSTSSSASSTSQTAR